MSLKEELKEKNDLLNNIERNVKKASIYLNKGITDYRTKWDAIGNIDQMNNNTKNSNSNRNENKSME